MQEQEPKMTYAPVRAETVIGNIRLRVDGFTVAEIKKHLDDAEKMLGNQQQRPTPTRPLAEKNKDEHESAPKEYDPEELMVHEWKGKKQPDGTYADGNLHFGWDFADNLSQEIVDVLIKGKLEVDGYTFSINENHKIITVREK